MFIVDVIDALEVFRLQMGERGQRAFSIEGESLVWGGNYKMASSLIIAVTSSIMMGEATCSIT